MQNDSNQGRYHVYHTNFNLTGSVTDLEAARAYLAKQDYMGSLLQERLHRDGIGANHVPALRVAWALAREDAGYIQLDCERELNEREITIVQAWIRGQHSDGLGEGFEQQAFAQITHGDDGNELDLDAFDLPSVGFRWDNEDYNLTYHGRSAHYDYAGELATYRTDIHVYETPFTLTGDIVDVDAAQRFLGRDGMLDIVRNDMAHTTSMGDNDNSPLQSIRWILDNESSGRVQIQSDRMLRMDERRFLNRWISEQHSDGIGESFEQQEFAECYEETYDGDIVYAGMTSFNWQGETYSLQRVTSVPNMDLSEDTLAALTSEPSQQR